MPDKTELTLVNGNTLELHYWFKDDSHTMDAFIHNKCELEILNIIKEVAIIFDAEITIETEPLAEGGIRRWFKIDKKGKNEIAVGVILAFVATIVLTPLSKVIEKGIEKLYEDSEMIELQKKNLKLENENLELENDKIKSELKGKKDTLLSSNKIKKHRSLFYESIEKYEKIEKVSFIIEDENKEKVEEEKIVERVKFKEFILVNDELPPINDENAVIEIISPVLKKGNYKWTGIYKNDTIDFEMKSNEFKTLVQSGDVNFKNGSSINCHLIIKRKINNEGLEKVVSYEVVRVNQYFQNDSPIETPEGKNHRQKKEADANQLKIFKDKQ